MPPVIRKPIRKGLTVLTYLTNLRNERDTLSATSSGMLEKAATEERSISDTEKSSIAKMAERCAVIDDELRTFSAQYESQKAYADLRAKLTDAEDAPDRKATDIVTRKAIDNLPKSWGAQFVESGEFRSYDGVGTSPRVHVPGLFTRAPIDMTGIGGLPVLPYTASVPGPVITTPLLDAVGHITTNSNVVQWLVESSTFPHAAVVPEGQPKPEANITLTTETGSLATVAHWKGITRQALSNLPMIQSIVETNLQGGIYAKLEADIADALAAAADPVIPDIDVGTEDDAFLRAVRVGIGTVQANGFPNAKSILLNPADWALLDLSVLDSTDQGPTRQTGFWGLAPIASSAIPAGTAYVGDVKVGVTLFDEGKASLYMSDSHSDFFIRNILVVLAEIMALAMVTQPKALVRITAPAGP